MTCGWVRGNGPGYRHPLPIWDKFRKGPHLLPGRSDRDSVFMAVWSLRRLLTRRKSSRTSSKSPTEASSVVLVVSDTPKQEEVTTAAGRFISHSHGWSEPAFVSYGLPSARLPELAPREPAPLTAWPRGKPEPKCKALAFSRTQQNIDELLEAHAADVEALRAFVLASEAAALFKPAAEHDAIFLLRFLLSNPEKGGKNVSKAAQHAVVQTLLWRRDNAELLAIAATTGEHPKAKEMSRLTISGLENAPTLLDEPVLTVRAGKSNVKQLMDEYDEEAVVEYLNFYKEVAALRCDAATRKTRRLVKMITIIDMQNSRLSNNDKRFFKALGRSSKDAELYYPQLLLQTICLNPPAWIHIMWAIGKRFMPAKTLAKVRFCAARDTTKESASVCPFATRAFTPDGLVDFLGGSAAPIGKLILPADRIE